MPASIRVEISPGELIDKITILEIKSEKITDESKLHNVSVELATLSRARDESVPASDELSSLTSSLKTVNERLWDIEDRIRVCDRDADFGEQFVDLARSVLSRKRPEGRVETPDQRVAGLAVDRGEGLRRLRSVRPQG